MFYNFRKNKKAFTLVELIVVVAIIAVLGTVVGIAVGSALAKSKKTACENNAGTVAQQIELFISTPLDDTTTKLGDYIKSSLGEAEYNKLSSWSSSLNTKTQADLEGSSTTYTVVYTHQGYKSTITLTNGKAKAGTASKA